jgi:hypothetical protein
MIRRSAPAAVRALADRARDLAERLVDPTNPARDHRFAGLGNVTRTTSAAGAALLKARLVLLDRVPAVAAELDRIARDPRLSDQAKASDQLELAERTLRDVAGALAAARGTARGARAALAAKADAARRDFAGSVLTAEDGRELRRMLLDLPREERAAEVRRAILEGGDEGTVAALVLAAGPIRSRLLSEAGIDDQIWSSSIAGWDSVLSGDMVLEREWLDAIDSSVEASLATVSMGIATLDKGTPADVELGREVATAITEAVA